MSPPSCAPVLKSTIQHSRRRQSCDRDDARDRRPSTPASAHSLRASACPRRAAIGPAGPRAAAKPTSTTPATAPSSSASSTPSPGSSARILRSRGATRAASHARSPSRRDLREQSMGDRAGVPRRLACPVEGNRFARPPAMRRRGRRVRAAAATTRPATGRGAAAMALSAAGRGALTGAASFGSSAPRNFASADPAGGCHSSGAPSLVRPRRAPRSDADGASRACSRRRGGARARRSPRRPRAIRDTCGRDRRRRLSPSSTPAAVLAGRRRQRRISACRCGSARAQDRAGSRCRTRVPWRGAASSPARARPRCVRGRVQLPQGVDEGGPVRQHRRRRRARRAERRSAPPPRDRWARQPSPGRRVRATRRVRGRAMPARPRAVRPAPAPREPRRIARVRRRQSPAIAVAASATSPAMHPALRSSAPRSRRRGDRRASVRTTARAAPRATQADRRAGGARASARRDRGSTGARPGVELDRGKGESRASRSAGSRRSRCERARTSTAMSARPRRAPRARDRRPPALRLRHRPRCRSSSGRRTVLRRTGTAGREPHRAAPGIAARAQHVRKCAVDPFDEARLRAEVAAQDEILHRQDRRCADPAALRRRAGPRRRGSGRSTASGRRPRTACARRRAASRPSAGGSARPA